MKLFEVLIIFQYCRKQSEIFYGNPKAKYIDNV